MSIDTHQLQEIAACLPDPVFILTESGRYAALLGGKDPRYYHDGSGLVGCRLHDVLPGSKADWFLEQIRLALRLERLHTVEYGLAGDDVDGLNPAAGPEGELWFEGRIQPLASLFEGERAVVWVARNITRHYEREVALRHSSETDALTGLFNRRKLLAALQERLCEFQRYGHPMALLMLDIDHFKAINDRYGHMIGDQVLCCVARVCAAQLREADLLFRFGGEEFVALLPNTALPQARLTAQRLRQQVEHEVKGMLCEASDEPPVTISIGVSELASGDTDIAAVLKRADDALYQAKRTGRNKVVIACD